MSTPPDPRREYANTYIVQDRSSGAEMTRLQIQDQMVTAGMGGVLSEQSEPINFQQVLDIGCGTGGWLLDVARTYPAISRLVGVDASAKMVDYARAQAVARQINDRAEFHIMDALLILEFPPDSFDLVNERLCGSFLRTWDWPKFLQECLRVTRPGGVIRLTETEIVQQSSSEALTRLNGLFLDAMHRSGHLFVPNKDGVIGELPALLQRHGLQQVQTCAHTLQFRAGTAEGQTFYENNQHAFRNFMPFLRRWIRLPDDYEAIYQQALHDMQQPDFVATWKYLTVWGYKP